MRSFDSYETLGKLGGLPLAPGMGRPVRNMEHLRASRDAPLPHVRLKEGAVVSDEDESNLRHGGRVPGGSLSSTYSSWGRAEVMVTPAFCCRSLFKRVVICVICS